MADVTVYHNPRCSTSRAALDAAAASGTEADVVPYLRSPLDEAGLRDLLGQLADAVGPGPLRDTARDAVGLLRRGVVDVAYLEDD